MTHPTTPTANIVSRVRALGANFDPAVLAATRAIYLPALDLREAPFEQPDLAYGPHARHRLDVYRPAGAPIAIVVFIHGGGFVGGDKNGDGAFYRNIGRWLARNGYAAVIPNYRLAPADAWPAGAVDVQAALQWVAAHRDTFGDAATPVALWGQSAGASHVASWLFDDAARGSAVAHVDAVMLMSGFYTAEAPLAAGPRAYFGEDPAQYAQRSPLTHVRPTTLPLWMAVAELDPGWMAQHTFALAQALALANGRSPDFHFFRDHNHVSTVQSLGSPQDDAAMAILDFLRRALGEGGGQS